MCGKILHDTPTCNYEHTGAHGAEHAFSYTGSMQSFTVPAGVSCITIELWGATGGDGSGVGGRAAHTRGIVEVTPRSTVSLLIGEDHCGISSSTHSHSTSCNWAGCGGGGTPLLVAGGGGEQPNIGSILMAVGSAPDLDLLKIRTILQGYHFTIF